jgi:hypothetical protein
VGLLKRCSDGWVWWLGVNYVECTLGGSFLGALVVCYGQRSDLSGLCAVVIYVL